MSGMVFIDLNSAIEPKDQIYQISLMMLLKDSISMQILGDDCGLNFKCLAVSCKKCSFLFVKLDLMYFYYTE